MTNNTPSEYEELGALIRTVRQDQGISMETLADRSNVSRSTIHRLEHGLDIRAQPHRLARIINALGISIANIENLLPTGDPQWRRQVIGWIGRLEAGSVENYISSAGRTFDLMAVRGEAVAIIEARGPDDSWKLVADDLTAAGWSVTRPM